MSIPAERSEFRVDKGREASPFNGSMPGPVKWGIYAIERVGLAIVLVVALLWGQFTTQKEQAEKMEAMRQELQRVHAQLQELNKNVERLILIQERR